MAKLLDSQSDITHAFGLTLEDQRRAYFLLLTEQGLLEPGDWPEFTEGGGDDMWMDYSSIDGGCIGIAPHHEVNPGDVEHVLHFNNNSPA